MKMRFLVLLFACFVVLGCSSRDRREAKAFVRSQATVALQAYQRELTAALADGNVTTEEGQRAQLAMQVLERAITQALAQLEEQD